ncbi:MAG: hypothetical protein JO340_17345 [Acidobacteriaceae bacterium]|nr:hypothetical protein [Acidobacteriaceae bacterium]
MPWQTSVRCSAAACALLLAASCEIHQAETGPPHIEPVSIGLGDAERAHIQLNLSAGELVVRGGATKLLEGQFEYSVAAWKPIVDQSGNGADVDVTIRQPHGGGGFGNTRNRWDLELNDKVLLDFTLDCGAGQTRLEMGDLNLQRIAVHMGAGQVDLDLRGQPSHDYDVTLAGGVGQATVRIPHNLGVRAEAHGGIGHVEVTGLNKRGDYYENSLYGASKANLRLKVEGGIGEIRIIG